MTGDITNAGSVSDSAADLNTATAAGFQINGDLTGAFSNTASLSVADSASGTNHEDVMVMGMVVMGHLQS
ncbi:hypothetical protein [Ruegeria sp. SCP11]|uniref:hypothetical protein n=1 Tax=Ruegeria sp. SCP11 TaxID=3141378 RepID=UPI00333CBFE2